MPLSDEEFQRFQNELVKLKTENYSLEGQNKKLTAENAQLKNQIENYEKESINLRLPSKMLPFKLRRTPGRDVDEIQRENEVLTRKVHTQEEEFKLQNETMMQELNEYMNKVQELENQLKLYKEGRHTNFNVSYDAAENLSGIQEENRHLKAENNVLQKKISELSAKTVESISTESSSNESFQKEDVEVECDDNRSEGGLVHVVSTKGSNGETKAFDTNSIRLETEQEEKRLLQEQLRQLEISSNEINRKLSKQIENLEEKLDEKQKSFLQLQYESEKRIQDLIVENTNIKSTNEVQLDVLKSDIKRLQDEIRSITKTKDDEVNKYQKHFYELQNTIDQLESQIGTVAAEQNQQLRDTNAEHQRILDDKELLLNQTILDRDCLRTETQQSKEAYETLLQTVQILEQQINTTTKNLESQQRVAEQRKITIDEMAVNNIQVEERAKLILQTQKEKHQVEIEKLEKEISELKIKDRTLKQMQSRYTELETRLKSEEELKQILSARLEEFQIEIDELKKNSEYQFNEQQTQNESLRIQERQEYQEQIQNLTEILSTKARTIEELNAQIDVLKQEASTFIDEKRTHERKGATFMKDLQKQLIAEKKKNERMQEKLTELLSGDKAALDELFYIPKTDGSRQGDTASVSSYGGTGYMDRASVTSTQMSPVGLEQENKDLIQKLARIQEERSVLEEKVRHLESSNSAMANDLIQHYSNDKRGSITGINTRVSTPPSRRRQNPSAERQSGPSLNLRNMFEHLSGNKSQSNNDEIIKNLQLVDKFRSVIDYASLCRLKTKYLDKTILMRQYYRRLYSFQRLPMNQKLLTILLPLILFMGTIIIYRSYQTSDTLTIISDKPVRVEFFVMSKCPDARKCETLFAPSLIKLSSIINFTVSFIAYETQTNQIECMHGPDECLGNKQQLCVQSMCSQTTLLKFLQCQSRQLANIPNNGEQCLKEASDGSIKWSDIDTCVKSDKGNELFHQSLQRTKSASAKKSCTMNLNGQFWCMHDGTWYGCSDGHDEKSFIKAICSRYNGMNKPAECTV
ncbi:hypothetical protein I4U23_028144 [Adineta vaga]|nr:hypothetical protein I4U23_028144 [Adineta vaga]